jgi:DNA-binding NtrC family response regulator
MFGKILIVDDNPHMATLLSEMLAVFDYGTVETNSCQHVLEILAGETFDMVIADVQLSDMSGFKLLQTVKAAYPNIPFVLMTGYSTTHNYANEPKPDGWLTRPLMMMDIEQILKTLL